ncbi:hypothetical protein V6N13_080214 [Hibiscus sabdariffa]
MLGVGQAMMEIDNQLFLFHLLAAYGEAKEKNQTELAEVILRCPSERGSSAGLSNLGTDRIQFIVSMFETKEIIYSKSLPRILR